LSEIRLDSAAYSNVLLVRPDGITKRTVTPSHSFEKNKDPEVRFGMQNQNELKSSSTPEYVKSTIMQNILASKK
jgi:hypothetical protein